MKTRRYYFFRNSEENFYVAEAEDSEFDFVIDPNHENYLIGIGDLLYGKKQVTAINDPKEKRKGYKILVSFAI